MTLDCYIYLYALDRKFSIPATPEQITNSANITFSRENILGRSSPLVTLSSAGPRTQQVSIVLHRQMMALENRNDLNTVDDLVNGLAAATLPRYIDVHKAVIPPSILCRFGNESCIRGVIDGNVQQTSSGPWLSNGKMAIVTITFSILELEPFSADYAVQNGYLRSISTDLRRSSVWQF